MRKKSIIINFLLILLLIFFNLPQVKSSSISGWDRTYGGPNTDLMYSMIQTSDSGYIMTGRTEPSPGNWDFWVVKTSSEGHMEWNKTYGGLGIDEAHSIIQTSDGGYAIVGKTASINYTTKYIDIWLVKTDLSGNVEWNRTYGGRYGDDAYSIAQTADGGYIIVGSTSDYYGSIDVFLVKTDLLGVLEWNITFGGSGYDRGKSVIQTIDGGFVFAGAYNGNMLLVKTNISGMQQWNLTLTGAEAECVVQTSDGGYAVASNIGAYLDFWLVKIDNAGNIQWNQTYGDGGANTDAAKSIIQTSDGGYAIAGITYSFGSGASDFWVVKTDSTGNVQWSQTYGGPNYDFPCSIVQTSEGGYAIAGYTNSYGAGGYDFWLIKTDENGVIPEFSLVTILPTLMMFTILTIALAKKRKIKI